MLRVYSIILMVLLCCLGTQAEPGSRNPIPDPKLIPEKDSFSIVVISLKGQDAAVEELLKAALKSITSGETKLGEDMAQVTDYLSRSDRAEMLVEGLPFQGVRVDRLLASGKPSPTYAFTLSGWRGLQRVMYNTMAADAKGDAFPSVTHGETELLKRTHHADPTWADNFCNTNGTFLFCPSLDQAKKAVDRLGGSPVNGPLLEAYAALPKTADAYGVVVNKNNEVSALLKTFDNEHIKKIREAVGSERLDRVVDSSKKVTWQIDIVSSERAEFVAVLQLDPANVAEAVAAFEDGKKGLDKERIVDFKVSQGTDTVTVSAAMVGLKKVMLDAMTSFGKKS